MKKFILIVFCFLAFLTYQSKADVAHDCPNGYESTTINLIINGCEYRVWVCYKCDYGISSADTSVVLFNGFRKLSYNCPQTWSTEQIKDYIVAYLSEHPSIVHELCQQAGFPPCSQPPDEPVGFKYRVETPMCWFKYCNFDETIEYIPCPNTNTCIYTYYICMDPVDNVQIITIRSGPFIRHHFPPYPQCFMPELDDPQPLSTTECFTLPTLCD